MAVRILYFINGIIVSTNCLKPKDLWIQLEWICIIYLAVPLEGQNTIRPSFAFKGYVLKILAHTKSVFQNIS